REKRKISNTYVLTRGSGTEETVQAYIHMLDWTQNDTLLFCSDGLTNKVSDKELQQVLQKYEDKEVLLRELIHLANERGGEDNITATLIANSPSEAGDDIC